VEAAVPVGYDTPVTLRDGWCRPMNYGTSLWQQRLERRSRDREVGRERTLEHAQRTLRRYFRDKRVKSAWLVGSVLRPGYFYEFSDVDVAVEGLGEPYFEVMSELEELLGRSVDLIELERCRFREELENRGVRLK
jgi:uncharacterized protein